MKKVRVFFAILLIAALSFALFACGGTEKEAEEKAKETAAEESKAEEAKKAEEEAKKAEEAKAAEEAKKAEEEAKAAEEAKKAEEEVKAAEEAKKAEEEAKAAEEAKKAEEEAKAAEEAKKAQFTDEGVYNAFAVTYDGYTVEPEVAAASGHITLEKGGKGEMTVDPDSMPIAEWKNEDGKFSFTLEDGSAATGTIDSGILTIDLYGNGSMLFLFAQEGADISGYEILNAEEYKAAYEARHNSKLYAVYQSIDPENGVHLKYDVHLESMGADQVYDVHEKAGIYYSSRTTKVAGGEDTIITFFKDGKAYSINPTDKTGSFVTETASLSSADMVLNMDELYSAIVSRALNGGHKEEEREVEGKKYAVEVYPASDYEPEAAFYFDGEGKLCYYLEGAPVIAGAVDIGEQFYTVHLIDSSVDDKLLDISEYNLSE